MITPDDLDLALEVLNKHLPARKRLRFLKHHGYDPPAAIHMARSGRIIFRGTSKECLTFVVAVNDIFNEITRKVRNPK